MSRTDRLELAFRTQELRPPERGDVVFLRAAPSPLLEALDPARLICEQSFRPLHDALAECGLRVTLRATGPAGMVLVNLTRVRAENLGNIARGLALLPPGGTLAVNGAKTDGVDSLARQVAALVPLGGALSKAHGRVFWLDRPAELPAVLADWAAATAPRRNASGFLAGPGMFSPDAPDPGSARLARAFDGRLKGRVADLGAGWGWLAAQALERCPGIAQIDLFEAEALALEAARANVTDPRAGFHWTDARTLDTGVPPYDAVVANPPFHQSRAADPELGAAFIAAAARILKPSGRLLIVANRQLPYEAPLDAHFREVTRLSEDAAYKVVAAERPRRA